LHRRKSPWGNKKSWSEEALQTGSVKKVAKKVLASTREDPSQGIFLVDKEIKIRPMEENNFKNKSR